MQYTFDPVEIHLGGILHRKPHQLKNKELTLEQKPQSRESLAIS